MKRYKLEAWTLANQVRKQSEIHASFHHAESANTGGERLSAATAGMSAENHKNKKRTSASSAEKAVPEKVVEECLAAVVNLAAEAQVEPAPKVKRKSEKLVKNVKKRLKKLSVLNVKNALSEPQLANEVKELNVRNDLNEACEEKEVSEESVLSEANEEREASAEKEVSEESALSEAKEESELSEVNAVSDPSGQSEVSGAPEESVDYKVKSSNEKIVTCVESDFRKVKKQSLKNVTSGQKAEVKESLLLWNSKSQLVILAMACAAPWTT